VKLGADILNQSPKINGELAALVVGFYTDKSLIALITSGCEVLQKCFFNTSLNLSF